MKDLSGKFVNLRDYVAFVPRGRRALHTGWVVGLFIEGNQTIIRVRYIREVYGKEKRTTQTIRASNEFICLPPMDTDAAMAKKLA